MARKIAAHAKSELVECNGVAMLSTTVENVHLAFQAAKNLNAALKNFIKREGASGAHVVSFAKDFRSVASSGKDQLVQRFIERHFPAKEFLFLGVARYAFPELVESSVGRIVDTYAEEFNATYEKTEGGISVTHAAVFRKIAREVLSNIRADIKAAGFGPNPFLENTLLSSVFEIDVLAEVLKAIQD